MKEKIIYIVVINWNGYDDTVECIESLKKIDYSNYKIVLLDNGSEGDDFSKLKYKFGGDKKIKLIHSKVNTGFAGGVNIGIKESISAKADYTLLLNNDVDVNKDFLIQLVKVAEKDKKIGIVASRIYYYDNPDKIWTNGSRINYYFPPFSWKYEGDTPKEVNDVVGCCMLIKNALFKDIGLFDEDYFAYGEESDFNLRACKAGYKIFVAPSSIIRHKVSASTGGGFNHRVGYLKMRNKILFGKKNLSLKYWPTYIIFLSLFFIKGQIIAFKNRNKQLSSALIKGVFDGI